jgi:hypothetical protein
MIVKQLKRQGMQVGKNYEKKQKIDDGGGGLLLSSVSPQQASINQIYTLLDKVTHYEEALASQPNS